MVKRPISLILIIFLLSNISASCNETQIDINAANLTQLDNLAGIGPAYAQRITDSRPFSSVDDLIKVNGIGNVTLNKIKEQGLACVVNEEAQDIEDNFEQNTETNNKTEPADNETEETINNLTASVTSNTVNDIPKSKTETITLTPISLNSQSIKSENNKEVLKKNLALYGIIAFCIMFGALFLLKQAGKKGKNEFR
jgi:competence ComEA-like helix-hairpin-helix protein